jgi:hypothetical protein
MSDQVKSEIVNAKPYYHYGIDNRAYANTESKNYTNEYVKDTSFDRINKIDNLTDKDIHKIKKEYLLGNRTSDTSRDNLVVSYVHIDSSERNKYPINILDFKSTELNPYPIYFTNGSSDINIYVDDTLFEQNDIVSIDGIVSKSLYMHNVVSVKKDSLYMRLQYTHHGMSLYGLYDPFNDFEFETVEYVEKPISPYNSSDVLPDTIQHYLLKKNFEIDLTINITNFKGNDISKNVIGNIPIGLINKRHTVFLVFEKQNTLDGMKYIFDPDAFLIQLPYQSSINYADGIDYAADLTINNNDITILYNNLYGIPLNYLNFSTPLSIEHKYPNRDIKKYNNKYVTINVGYNAIVDPTYSFYVSSDFSCDNDIRYIINNNGGGINCAITNVVNITQGYPNPNRYFYPLGEVFKNVIQIEIIESIFPNSQRIINNNNNSLYWSNLCDGIYIYKLYITPGNYTPNQMEKVIEKAFSKTPRYKYSTEYETDMCDKIISNLCINGNCKYDDNGYYKFHSVKVKINTETDVVTFSFYKKRILIDDINPSITVLDTTLRLTMAENLCINFGSAGTNIVPQQISPFNPSTEKLFWFFTQNTHIRVTDIYSYANNNLYQYQKHILPYTTSSNGTNTIQLHINTDQQILLNFYRNKSTYNNVESTTEINSINTQTILNSFVYDHLTKIVTLSNHNLTIGAIIITDKFNNLINPNNVYLYEITVIINSNSFIVNQIQYGTKYKIIYDGLLINFATNPVTATDVYTWQDQILYTDPILNLAPLYPNNNNTLSVTSITTPILFDQYIRIYQPNHGFTGGEKIHIFKSQSVRYVSNNSINKKQVVHNIIDPNNYIIVLCQFEIECQREVVCQNRIIVRYPDITRMYFNYTDTLGNILCFDKVGQQNAITRYLSKIKNTDKYAIDYTYITYGPEYETVLKKLDINQYNYGCCTRLFNNYDYFYIISPPNGFLLDTGGVSDLDVFSKVHWSSGPDTVCYNKHFDATKVYDRPLSTLSSFRFAFYHPNGELVNFNGMDHSFTLKITELYSMPPDTNISEEINKVVTTRIVDRK